MSNNLSPGTSSTYAVSFSADDGTVYTAPSAQVMYKLLSEDRTETLNEGYASNTALQPEEWTAIVTLPTTAPKPERAPFLYLQWSLVVNGISTSVKEYPVEVEFSSDESELDDQYILIPGLDLQAELGLQHEADTVEATIVNESGTELVTKRAVPFSRMSNGLYVYQLNLTAAAVSQLTAGGGVAPYNIMWRTTTKGVTSQEVHFVYAISGKMFNMINSLRRFMDKARNLDIDVSLQWQDVELLHFCFEGLNRINGSPPANITWVPNTLPYGVHFAWEQASIHRALNALFLAEGYRAFSFSGQATTLEVDRTAIIQTKMDEINSWLETHLEKVKKAASRGSNVGTLGLTFSRGGIFNPSGIGGAEDRLARRLSSRLV